MNKVFLTGNLTRDPEAGETSTGISYCRFSLAVNRDYLGADGERQTDFFNCTAWRTVGETIARYCKKGNKVNVIGSIQLRSYEDKEGVKHTAVDIIVENVDFLTPKSKNAANEVPEPPAHVAKKGKLQPMEGDGDIPF